MLINYQYVIPKNYKFIISHFLICLTYYSYRGRVGRGSNEHDPLKGCCPFFNDTKEVDLKYDLKKKLNSGVQTSSRTKDDEFREKLYVLDFGLFLNKDGYGIDEKGGIDLLQKINDHWDSKIQAHVLVYMFTQACIGRTKVLQCI